MMSLPTYWVHNADGSGNNAALTPAARVALSKKLSKVLRLWV
jgi:hypothetical protein